MNDTHEIKMMTPFTMVLLLVMGLGLIVAIYRLYAGLGNENLADRREGRATAFLPAGIVTP